MFATTEVFVCVVPVPLITTVPVLTILETFAPFKVIVPAFVTFAELELFEPLNVTVLFSLFVKLPANVSLNVMVPLFVAPVADTAPFAVTVPLFVIAPVNSAPDNTATAFSSTVKLVPFKPVVKVPDLTFTTPANIDSPVLIVPYVFNVPVLDNVMLSFNSYKFNVPVLLLAIEVIYELSSSLKFNVPLLVTEAISQSKPSFILNVPSTCKPPFSPLFATTEEIVSVVPLITIVPEFAIVAAVPLFRLMIPEFVTSEMLALFKLIVPAFVIVP